MPVPCPLPFHSAPHEFLMIMLPSLSQPTPTTAWPLSLFFVHVSGLLSGLSAALRPPLAPSAMACVAQAVSSSPPPPTFVHVHMSIVRPTSTGVPLTMHCSASSQDVTLR